MLPQIPAPQFHIFLFGYGTSDTHLCLEGELSNATQAIHQQPFPQRGFYISLKEVSMTNNVLTKSGSSGTQSVNTGTLN